MPITKIISGGQTGADRAGLDAAHRLAIPTGGTAPRGYRTEDGPCYALRDDYGLSEHSSYEYTPRTRKNVENSDGTLLMGNVRSPGSQHTKGCCYALDKPYIENPTPEELLEWIEDKGISTLNVAGNRASKNPLVFRQTFDLLVEALSC